MDTKASMGPVDVLDHDEDCVEDGLEDDNNNDELLEVVEESITAKLAEIKTNDTMAPHKLENRRNLRVHLETR
jgi:hypothetical protein